MGLCGFTYAEAQKMPTEALRRAIVARKEHDAAPWHALFKAFFGEPEAEQSKQQSKVSAFNMTPRLFDALFQVTH